MDDDFIDYGELIDDAMHIIVKQVLDLAQKEGLPGAHHFYISFLTGHSGVSVSERLKAKYPEDMTIVLQHQFEGLTVDDHKFGVTLSFEGVKESIIVPFDALTAFADPSVKFGLQFRSVDMFEEDELSDLDLEIGDVQEFLSDNMDESSDAARKKPSKGTKPSKPNADEKDGSNVVSIDSFRKK
jgi:hypothetical protein